MNYLLLHQEIPKSSTFYNSKTKQCLSSKKKKKKKRVDFHSKRKLDMLQVWISWDVENSKIKDQGRIDRIILLNNDYEDETKLL